MMTRIIGKDEEIKLLRSFQRKVELLTKQGDTYLQHLFTDTFMHAVEQDIRDDVSPDLEGRLAYAHHQHSHEEARANQAERDLQAALNAIAETPSKRAFDDLMNTHHAEAREVEVLRHELERTTETLRHANDLLQKEIDNGRAIEDERRGLQYDVQALKLQMFDYVTRENAQLKRELEGV